MINSSEVPRTFKFKDLYVITSSIDKYIGHPEAEYVKVGKLLDEKTMQEYSSNDAVIPKEQIKSLFKSFGLLE
jgi:hypothetical protein